MSPILPLLLLSLYLTLGTTLAQDDEEPLLRVLPPAIAVTPGEEVSLVCSHYPEDLEADLELQWYLPNSEEPISAQEFNETTVNTTQDDILRFSSENGTLTITNASLSDSGTYVCRNVDRTLEVEAEVKVYVMPSYVTEIMVVLAINAVLVLVFLGCYFWSIINDRRYKKQQQAREKLGHKR
ncbi:uncharacterized protein LOC127833376 [Dreissena polymorpha]|uniref:Ig-like domain-containing protein n=1 Tax=Dreissena polymorpha TaxID=45954 RepID=A0A9D4G5I7_DREPO|nr:uncharacterized protein LOC127833376 [Dreissena polymorpha]XP_052214557.1 uncharacterized protein LOC127833376 [Dreissena polymorpha]XP_052214558.1 uncharacterized protein LOC127833376 [Dreissena polymorpha]KAH3810781.1 hypothetical protein DPMN_139179 [Dreissena polymorpha]